MPTNIHARLSQGPPSPHQRLEEAERGQEDVRHLVLHAALGALEQRAERVLVLVKRPALELWAGVKRVSNKILNSERWILSSFAKCEMS